MKIKKIIAVLIIISFPKFILSEEPESIDPFKQQEYKQKSNEEQLDEEFGEFEDPQLKKNKSAKKESSPTEEDVSESSLKKTTEETSLPTASSKDKNEQEIEGLLNESNGNEPPAGDLSSELDNKESPVEKEPQVPQQSKKVKPIERYSDKLDHEGYVKAYHPNAAKGLLRINKDGSYQYKVKARSKSKSASFSLSVLQPPTISSSVGASYKTMYGSDNIYGLTGNYEWMPFRKFGSLGLVLESGISTSKGRGVFGDGYQAEEQYTLYIVPLSLFLKYRLEFVSRQFIVPYIEAGGTYYGLLELRDDGTTNKGSSFAAGGGGGLLLNISRIDPQAAFRMDRDYGIADIWVFVSARALAGIKKDIDFTSVSLYAGMAFDF